MAQAVEANPRREAAVELRFGGRIGRGTGLGNTSGQRAIVERDETGILGHGRSIAAISVDV
jgi:hypothetical protein